MPGPDLDETRSNRSGGSTDLLQKVDRFWGDFVAITGEGKESQAEAATTFTFQQEGGGGAIG